MHAIVEDVFYDRAAAPTALIFGNDTARRRDLASLIASQGGVAVGTENIAEAVVRLDESGLAKIVVVDAGEGDAALDALLDRIFEAAAARRFDALVLLPDGRLDLAAWLSDVPGITVAAARDLGTPALVLAVAEMFVPAPTGVAEEGDEAFRRRLAVLGEEAGRIARALTAMAVSPDGEEASPVSPDPAAELAFLRAHLRLRRMRERCFDAALFADPAWDILLDLRLAALEGRRVSVSSLCIAAAVPATTGLRWIGLMTERGLLSRIPDPADGRRAFIALSPIADAAMLRFAAMALRVGTA